MMKETEIRTLHRLVKVDLDLDQTESDKTRRNIKK